MSPKPGVALLLCEFAGVIRLSGPTFFPAVLRKGQDTKSVTNRKLSEMEENNTMGHHTSVETQLGFC